MLGGALGTVPPEAPLSTLLAPLAHSLSALSTHRFWQESRCGREKTGPERSSQVQGHVMLEDWNMCCVITSDMEETYTA